MNFQKIEVVNRLKKELAHQTIKNYTITYDQTWIFSKIQYSLKNAVTKLTNSVVVTPYKMFLSINLTNWMRV